MSKIEWTDRTWSPVTGCTKISEGCKNCYAERMARRLAGRYGYPAAPNHFDVTVHEDKLEKPLKRKKPTTYFVCSMGDLFHEDVPDDFIGEAFAVMDNAKQHAFQLLTKRPERMREFMDGFQDCGNGYVSPHIWPGVSVENQETADERIPILLDTPGAVRFVSLEPMLGSVCLDDETETVYLGIETYHHTMETPDGTGIIWHPGLDWVIVGCESGPNRRPCDINWIRDVRDQCIAADIPFFLKQMEIGGKVVKMPELDGKVWAEMPERSA